MLHALQDGDPMGMLLFDYLVHEGHWDTATKVAQDILLGRVEVSQQVSPVWCHHHIWHKRFNMAHACPAFVCSAQGCKPYVEPS